MDASSPIDPLLERPVRWLQPGASDSRIAISSRVRLARNLAGQLFPLRASPPLRRAVLARVSEAVSALPALNDGIGIEMADLDELHRRLLAERRMVGAGMVAGEPGTGVFISRAGDSSVMVNHEDHVRIQALTPGCRLAAAWKTARRLDEGLAEGLEYARGDDTRLLTARPRDAGSGLRASVLLHLPGLCLGGQIAGVVRAAGSVGFEVDNLLQREGADHGKLFQIANRTAGAASEEETIERLGAVVEQIAEHEENARKLLLDREPNRVFDLVGRAYGVLRYAYRIGYDEALDRLSALRLGAELSMFSNLDGPAITRLVMAVSPAHLQKRLGRRTGDEELAGIRARLLRQWLRDPEAGDPGGEP